MSQPQPSVPGSRTVRQVPTRRGSAIQPSWVNEGAHRERFRQIEPHVRGRSVLDIGCASGWQRPDWMHGLIADVAKDVVGVDVDAEAAGELNARGYEMLVADATALRLERTFDVVHAGELIEHLDDAGGFLETARIHMSSGSRLLITTPNAFCFTNFLYRLPAPARVNRDHVCWYCEDTLRQLLERHHFDVVDADYLTHVTPGRVRSFVGKTVRAALPDRLAWNTLFFIARLAN